MANRKAQKDERTGNNRSGDHDRLDRYDQDLMRDSSSANDQSTMAGLAGQAGESRGDEGGITLPHVGTEDGREHPQHARQGQAESPREATHYEPPKHKEGHH